VPQDLGVVAELPREPAFEHSIPRRLSCGGATDHVHARAHNGGDAHDRKNDIGDLARPLRNLEHDDHPAGPGRRIVGVLLQQVRDLARRDRRQHDIHRRLVDVAALVQLQRLHQPSLRVIPQSSVRQLRAAGEI